MGSHRQAGVGVRCYSCAREESILHITPVNTVPHPSQELLSLTQSTTLPVMPHPPSLMSSPPHQESISAICSLQLLLPSHPSGRSYIPLHHNHQHEQHPHLHHQHPWLICVTLHLLY